MQTKHELSSRSLAAGAVAGGLLGAGCWAALAFGLSNAFGMDVWLGHVFSSPINAATFTAFGAALGQLLQRLGQLRREAEGMNLALLGAEEDTLLLPDDVKTARKQLHDLSDAFRRSMPVRLLTVGLLRARANWSATDVSGAIESEANLIAEEVAASYSNIRYLAWAIPSIGFIGTVLGIGWAMGDLRITGDDKVDPLASAATHLSMAFDTTFVALVLSLILMLVLHRVEARDDSLLTRVRSWSLRRLPLRMHITKEN